MSAEILVTQTKILVPRRRAEILSRPRLLNVLLEALDQRLVIVAAPAGYGKTSLLIDFCRRAEFPVCWLALDSLDRDPLRFLTHFIAAIQLRFPAFGKSSQAALNSMDADNLNLDLLVSVITNDAYEHIHEHFIFVLDDYHLVDDSRAVNHFISRFVQDVDENCHLFVASRTLLTLPDLPLLVARAQVSGLSFEELAFQAEEIQQLVLRNYRVALTDSAARSLAQQSEGWITGLLLSTQMLAQETGDWRNLRSVAGVGLYDYLAQQVLQRQPPEVQTFLQWTSLLDEFNLPLCAEVIGQALEVQADWSGLMEQVLRNNLFVLPVGEESLWLRYHHLFRDFLRDRILKEHPADAQKIRRRLAEYYTRQRQWEQAYAVYQQLEDVEATAGLIETCGAALVAGSRLALLLEWIEALPPAMQSRPSLLSLHGIAQGMRGNLSQGLAELSRAIDQLTAADSRLPLAWTLTRRAALHHMAGDYHQSLADADRALALEDPHPQMRVIHAEAMRARGVIHFHHGELPETVQWYTRALEVFRDAGEETSEARVLADLGIAYRLSGDFAAAEKTYQQALAYWETTNNAYWQATLYNSLGVLQHMLGNYTTAASTFEKAILNAQYAGYPRMEAFALASIGDLYRDLGAMMEAMEAYRQARFIANRIADRYLLFYLDLAEVRLARLRNQVTSSREQLQRAYASARESGSQYELSLCRLEEGNTAIASQLDARPLLEEALSGFNRGGYKLEALRAHLLLAIACHRTNELALAYEHLNQATALGSEIQNMAALITLVRENKAWLKNLPGTLGIGPAVASLLKREAEFEARLPGLRNQIRRKATIVPFAPPHLVIRALGRNQVKINDRAVVWQMSSTRDLFFLLLAHPEGLSKEAIGLLFWEDASPADIRLRFKNSIYRLRQAVGKEAIELNDEIYTFNRSLDYEYDVETFEKELENARQANNNEQRLKHYLAALESYKGAFLPDIEGSWVVAERERLHQAYLDLLLKVAAILHEQRQSEEALRHLQKALAEDRCLEAAHRQAMLIYAGMGNRAGVARQYELCRQALEEEFGAQPSPQTEDLYTMLIRQ